MTIHDICHPTTPDSQQILKACPLLTSRITNVPLCVLGILLTLNLLSTLPIRHTLPRSLESAFRLPS